MAPTRTLPSHPRPIDFFPGRAAIGSWLVSACCFALALWPLAAVNGEPIHRITIDGNFGDWDSVPSHSDPLGTDMHNGIPDVHDTDHGEMVVDPADPLVAVNHPDVDILEYKFTHDENNLYAYFRATGEIGRTQVDPPKAGRYYVIVTIDVDNNDDTGYWLHEGGYYPTSTGYDFNMEAEFYDGKLNTGHYLSHDAADVNELQTDFYNLTSKAYTPAIDPSRNEILDEEISANAGPYIPGIVDPAVGNYDNYTQWVYQENDLADENDDQLTLVVDEGPVVKGIIDVLVSDDGHEIEMRAPFLGFLKDSSGQPNMALGKTIDISFSLEASKELAPDRKWASDTADPIEGYFLGVPEPITLLLAGLASIALATTTGRRRR